MANPPEIIPDRKPYTHRFKDRVFYRTLRKRWAELAAGTANAVESLRAAYRELGVEPGDNHQLRSMTQKYRNSKHLMAYLEKCKKALAKNFPNGVNPAWEKGWISTKDSHKYTDIDEFKAKVDEYFDSKQDGEAIELTEMCVHLGISWFTFFEYAKRSDEWYEAIHYTVTRCAAYINKVMMGNPKMSIACNYMLNRLHMPEHPDQAARHRAEIEKTRAEIRSLDKGVEVADQLTQLMQEIHGNGGRRFVPSNVPGIGPGKLIESVVETGESVLDS